MSSPHCPEDSRLCPCGRAALSFWPRVHQLIYSRTKPCRPLLASPHRSPRCSPGRVTRAGPAQLLCVFRASPSQAAGGGVGDTLWRHRTQPDQRCPREPLPCPQRWASVLSSLSLLLALAAKLHPHKPHLSSCGGDGWTRANLISGSFCFPGTVCAAPWHCPPVSSSSVVVWPR